MFIFIVMLLGMSFNMVNVGVFLMVIVFTCPYAYLH